MLTQKLKDFTEDSIIIAKVFTPGLVFALVMYACTFLPAKEYSKILPHEQGGLPIPFMTELVDDNKDGIPDRVFLHSIGPGYYNGQVRKPTQSEIEWYKSH